MKSASLAGLILGTATAQVVQPTQAHPWREVSILPNVWLADSTKISLFSDNGVNKITFQGKIDNGGQSPIEADGVVGVARGFFLQDMTYGFDSLDGFVIHYKGQSGVNAAGNKEEWGVQSLKNAAGDKEEWGVQSLKI